ncbi:cation diffusion facilitator family transporter [Arthrobacter sp. LS16]|uniref:cation diffusion facilitator family transporter n=1 Tax=Arthrobacter sp. 'calajunan' TaxID=1690248 RepID=UPI003C761DDD
MNSSPGTHLPEEQKRLMRRAAKLEWISVGYAVCTITVVALVVGNSQAMRTAWVEDMLSVLPQLAFLIALRWTRKPRRPRQPYGYHRSMGAGHLVAGVALLVVGAMLAYESITALVKTEHPTIGTVNLFGHTIWQGWPMIAVMTVIVIPALILGRLKIKVAKPLHNKLLYADSKMAKADWQTNAASIVGVAGIGLGIWWLDAVAALVISLGILKDGWDSTRSSTSDLLDSRASDLDGTDPHPLVSRIEEQLARMNWVEESAVRARELGQVQHIEVFVVPHSGQVGVKQVAEACAELEELDWPAYDVVMIPVSSIPDYLSKVPARV